MNKKAFTLIELLIVVLIIAILAAIAVPQYKKAVLRSRFSALVTAVNTLKEAQYRHKMSTGGYTNDRDNLDIEFPGSKERFPTSKSQLNLIKGKASCGIEGIDPNNAEAPASNVYCTLDTPYHISLMYFLNIRKKRCCIAIAANADELCQKEVGTTEQDPTSVISRRCYYH